MNEVPYPTPVKSTSEVVVAYSLREIIDQINKKLDLLPSLVMDQASMKDATSKLEARILVAEGKLELMEKADTLEAGGVLFKDKVMAKLVALASVMGVVAGITFALLNLFL